MLFATIAAPDPNTVTANIIRNGEVIDFAAETFHPHHPSKGIIKLLAWIETTWGTQTLIVNLQETIAKLKRRNT